LSVPGERQRPFGWLLIRYSTPGPLYSVAQAFKFADDAISVVPLDLDASVLDRSAGAQPLLQLGGKLHEAGFIKRQVGDDCHPFAPPTLRLSAHADDRGLARGRWLALASAGVFKLVTLGAKQVSPTMFSHDAILFKFWTFISVNHLVA
jgi:hypothetical protein